MGPNHYKFVQVFKDKGGQVFSTKQIEALMKSHSNINPGSIRPNDHAGGNKSPCKCARNAERIFDRISYARYKVRPNAGLSGGASLTVSPSGGPNSPSYAPVNIAQLWSSINETEWENAVNKYWSYVKPKNFNLEKKLNKLSLTVKAPSNIPNWYEFLRSEYFPWKYTDPRYSPVKHFEKAYDENASGLNAIIVKLFAFKCQGIKQELLIGKEIAGLGVAGASGLLSLLFPNDFGTVDRFVVEALKKVPTLPEAKKLAKMKPVSLTVSNGVVLIEIMRAKAKELNSLFCTTFWTPRKIDMLLWAAR